jgi:hypothetical protein
VLPGQLSILSESAESTGQTTAKPHAGVRFHVCLLADRGEDLTRVLFVLKSRAQLFASRLCYICMGFVSCGSVAFSQQRTEHGFYFPVDSQSSHQGLQDNLSEALAGCTADSEAVHPGVDLLADAGAPVYAISEGVVAARSSQHLSPEVVALLVRHKPRSGAEFFAIYGNIRTALKAGMSVTAGESIGVVGHSPRLSHLHFAVFVSGGDASRALADWNLSQCSRWPDRVKYIDPLQWLGPLQVADDSALNRCDLNGDGVVDLKDVELGRQMALKLIPCTADLNMDGECNVIDVQRLVNASLTGVCRVGR